MGTEEKLNLYLQLEGCESHGSRKATQCLGGLLHSRERFLVDCLTEYEPR